MTKPAAPSRPPVRAFPRPEGENIPDRIFVTDQIVTGEAVALKIQPASPIQLIGAGVIDLALMLAGTLSALVFLTRIGSQNLEAASTYIILAIVIAVIAIPSIVETATLGKSVGKWALGVQIVRDDGGAIRFRHAFIRSLTGMLETYVTFGSIALIATIANPRHKRLGDLLAGTYPISLNIGAQLPPPLLMPAELVPWAHQVDVSQPPGDLAWRVRQFLNHAQQLDPIHRNQAARDLAAEMLAAVSMPPPDHTHPERFLAAALVIRRDIEYHHHQRTERALQDWLPQAPPYGL